ncbi:MAG TPA: hypothetical protein VFV73_32830 [Streptosporangiaceae bacterium]|nr:hypothetical protein [Streptosporangiaceae bacterium]
MITEAELRRMTPEERSQLARTLVAIDHPHPLTDPRRLRRRRFGLMFMLACCLGLAAWIAILLVTLPMRYVSHDWRGVWVGLDLAELIGFAATAWAAWNQRQVLIVLMNVTGTLLVCDAWFDLALAWGSRGFTMSLVTALVAELPLALLLFTSARRLVRVTLGTMMRLTGVAGPVPPLWRIPLFADGLEEALPARLRPLAEQARARAETTMQQIAPDVTAAEGSSS